MRIFLFSIMILLGPVLIAGAAKKQTRAPAQNSNINSPTKVISFACKESIAEPDAAVGLALLMTDVTQPNSGTLGLSVYYRTKQKNPYEFKQLSGRWDAVPEGMVLRTQWTRSGSSTSDVFFLHLHPKDSTVFPGSTTKLSCEVTGEIQNH